MNDHVRGQFTDALDEYRRNMKVSGGDLTFQAGCEAIKQQMIVAVTSTLFAELEGSKAAFARTLVQQLPAPPQHLQVESETLPMDERIEKEIDWRRFASSARGDE
jgi:hypothetical protein